MRTFGIAAIVAWCFCLVAGLLLTSVNVQVLAERYSYDKPFLGVEVSFLYVTFTAGLLLIAVSLTALHWLKSRSPSLIGA